MCFGCWFSSVRESVHISPTGETPGKEKGNMTNRMKFAVVTLGLAWVLMAVLPLLAYAGRMTA